MLSKIVLVIITSFGDGSFVSSSAIYEDAQTCLAHAEYYRETLARNHSFSTAFCVESNLDNNL